MQKIMFNEHFGLQQATFDGSKTMTRRKVPSMIMKDALAYQSHHIDDEKAYEKYILDHAPYKVGEIVAVAQRYRDIYPNADFEMIDGEFMTESRGWSNKMYVKAEYMIRHIKITGIKVEGLAGISDEDCLREGIIDTGSGFTCYKRAVLPLFRTPYAAFEALINKLNRRGFFESNPMVYAYTYELVD